jgi:DNA-directed RNA polymerase specialized sigma24 family protein
MIKVLTENVALDYFRMHHAVKRGSSGTVVLESASAPELGASAETLDRHILLTELDQALKGKTTSRDRTIYWLHYHQGFSAMKIAQLPDVGLTAKGVESVLSRITKLMRSELNLRHNL